MSFRQLFAGSEIIRVFSVGRIVHPVVFDLYGMIGGFHGCWLDQEHAGITYEQIVLASACAGQRLRYLRADGDDWLFPSDAEPGGGAGGLMAARVESAAHAEEFMSWVKFPPRGRRGLNVNGRDGDYGGLALPEYIVRSNAENVAIVQIETLGAFEQADEIAAIDGVQTRSSSARAICRLNWACWAGTKVRGCGRLTSALQWPASGMERSGAQLPSITLSPAERPTSAAAS